MTSPLNICVFFAPPDGAYALTPPQVKVRLDGRIRHDVRPIFYREELGQVPTARFECALGKNAAGTISKRAEEAAKGIKPGQSIQSTILRQGILARRGAGDCILFDGYITDCHMSLKSDGETVIFDAEDACAATLSQRLSGQFALGDTQQEVVILTASSLLFNPDGRPNAAEQQYQPPQEPSYTVFAPPDSISARAWLLHEAVAYLLCSYGDEAVLQSPLPEEIEAACGDLTVHNVRLEGLTLAEGLDRLCALAGLYWKVRITQDSSGQPLRRLELVKPETLPGVRLMHQAPGQMLNPARTNLREVDIRMKWSDAPRRYLAVGDVKLFEATFDMVKGWDPNLESSDWGLFSPRQNGDFDRVRNVFRKWVLNEAGDYSDTPYNQGDPYDFSTIFSTGDYIERRRKFLNCISRDTTGNSFGIFVEVSLDSGSTWTRYTGGIRCLKNECGIYLSDDQLPAEFLHAAIRDNVHVRVTATVESDQGLSAQWEPEDADELSPGRTRFISAARGFRFRKVSSQSIFYGASSQIIGTPDEADDSAALGELITAIAEKEQRSPVPAEVIIPWISIGYRCGSPVVGISGREFLLTDAYRGYQTAPHIRRVERRFGERFETVLTID